MLPPQILALVTMTLECLFLDKFPLSSHTHEKQPLLAITSITSFFQAQVYRLFLKYFSTRREQNHVTINVFILVRIKSSFQILCFLKHVNVFPVPGFIGKPFYFRLLPNTQKPTHQNRSYRNDFKHNCGHKRDNS